jgi:Fic family protein
VQRADFTENFPGTLVPTERGALAFVPAPAPDGLDLEPATVALLARAERALGHLTGTIRAAGKQVNPHLVSAPLLRREAISSSKIEGTNTTPEQLVLLELEPPSTSPSGNVSETQEVLNYISALNHGFRRLREIPVCLRLLQELHEILMRGVRGDAERPGEFRNVQNFIGASQDIRQARFVPPPVAEMRRCLEQLEIYMNEAGDTLPHLVRVALVHYQFETIHPFRDGNGRVGRIIVPLLLCSYERLEGPTLYLSPYFERHRTQYTDLLLRVSQTGDFGSWVRFFLEAVDVSASESIRRAEALLQLREDYRRRLQGSRASAALLALVDGLFERPSVSLAHAATLLGGVTPAAASANVRKLVDAGILAEVTGRKRDQRFVANEIIRVAHSDEP